MKILKWIWIIIGLVIITLFFLKDVYAENSIKNYGYYENKNEISAKDQFIGYVKNIFDFENSSNSQGEKIKDGRFYIETKYKGGYNGTDADYIYLDEVMNAYKPQIDNNTSEINKNSIKINGNKNNIINNTNTINDEIINRTKIDKDLQKQINKNNKRNNKQDTKINKNTQKIKKETKQRKKVDKKLNNKITKEKETRIKNDNKLKNKINIEKNNRKKVDNKLNDKITNNKGNIKVNKKNINLNAKEIKAVDLNQTRWNKKQDKTLDNHNIRINNNTNRINDLDNRISDLEETQHIIGGKVRIYDSKKWQVNLFADYSETRNKFDRVGMRFTYKFGKSYEEKRIEELENKINLLLEQ